MPSVFSRIIAGEIPAKVLFEDDRCVAFHDLNPKAPVHVLIVPKKEIARVAEAKAQDEVILGHLLTTAAAVAVQLNISETGFRLVINNGADAGESVPHLHVHLLGGRSLAWPPG